MAIYVIDEMMGRGKTSAMINQINASGKNERFLFITPLLTEVERVKTSCADREFCEPEDIVTKLCNLKQLLQDRQNVVSTHALFSRFDGEVLNLVRENEYTLVMDEVTQVVTEIRVTNRDSELILGSLATTDEKGLLTWNDKDYQGKFGEYMDTANARNLYVYNQNYWIDIMSPEMFRAFKNVFIMTYMFDCQVHKYYFDLMDLPFTHLYVEGNSRDTYSLSTTKQPPEPVPLDEMITIVDDYKLNCIGNDWHSLSKSWYIRHAYDDQMSRMQLNIYNYFHNVAHTPSSLNLWTTFALNKDENNINWPRMLSGKGYTKGFLGCTSKGTNQYQNRKSLAYTVNMFMKTSLRNFFVKNGVEVDERRWATSEMVQWIWRSAIRHGEPVSIYVPSRRMRTYLTEWIAEVSQT